MKTVFFILPDRFSIRNFLYTPFAENQFSRFGLRVVFVVPHREIHEKNKAGEKKDYVLEDIQPSGQEGVREKIKSKIASFLYQTVKYRFCKIHKFQHLEVKENIPREHLIKKEEDSFKFLARFPFPRSRAIFSFFYFLYRQPIFLNRHAKTLFSRYRPDVVISADSQRYLARNYLLLAKKYNAKVISYINSWDNLFMHGPLINVADEFTVWGAKVAQQLNDLYHTKKPVHNIGPIQMDHSFRHDFVWNKQELCRQYNIPENKKIILFGVYNERLGRHEPSIAEFLIHQVLEKYRAHLMIRGHPQDKNFLARYQAYAQNPAVTLIPGQDFSESSAVRDDRIVLNSILKNAEVVLCGLTTLSLDAIRFDKPVINVMFDGTLKLPPAASIVQRFRNDHYAEFLKYGAVYCSRSFEELASHIHEAFFHPDAKAAERQKIKELYLEPLDGHASERMLELVKKL